MASTINLPRILKGSATRFINKSIEYSPALLRKVPNSEIAKQIAKTSDKKSKEYKAAMRNLQRWKKGDRKPSGKSKKMIEEATKKAVKENPALVGRVVKGGEVVVNGMICYSSDCRERSITLKFGAEDMGRFLELSQVDYNAAMDFYFGAYEVPGMWMESGTVKFQ